MVYVSLFACVAVVVPPVWYCARRWRMVKRIAQRGIQGRMELRAQQPLSDQEIAMLQGAVASAESAALATAVVDEYLSEVSHALRGARFTIRAAARASLFAGTALSLALFAQQLAAAEGGGAAVLSGSPFAAGAVAFGAASALGHSAEQWTMRARDAWNGVALLLRPGRGTR